MCTCKLHAPTIKKVNIRKHTRGGFEAYMGQSEPLLQEAPSPRHPQSSRAPPSPRPGGFTSDPSHLLTGRLCSPNADFYLPVSWEKRGVTRVCCQDAGVHGDDHHVLAVGQAEASAGSAAAAAAAAAHHRTRADYLSRCEWVDFFYVTERSRKDKQNIYIIYLLLSIRGCHEFCHSAVVK